MQSIYIGQRSWLAYIYTLIYVNKATAFRIFHIRHWDITMRTTDSLCTSDCQCYRLCNPWHFAPETHSV